MSVPFNISALKVPLSTNEITVFKLTIKEHFEIE